MLVLYIKDYCAFSKKALDAVARYKVPVTIKNRKNKEAAHELSELQGSLEVPYMVDTDAGKVIDESDSIVEYLSSKALKVE